MAANYATDLGPGALLVAGTRHTEWSPPVGVTASPRRFFFIIILGKAGTGALAASCSGRPCDLQRQVLAVQGVRPDCASDSVHLQSAGHSCCAAETSTHSANSSLAGPLRPLRGAWRGAAQLAVGAAGAACAGPAAPRGTHRRRLALRADPQCTGAADGELEFMKMHDTQSPVEQVIAVPKISSDRIPQRSVGSADRACSRQAHR